MSFDRDALISACRKHGIVARVVVAKVRGSAPREVGAAMLVWEGGQIGTIGGGTLEFEISQAALKDAYPGQFKLTQHALGPDLGQCCGGNVEVLTEVFDLEQALSLPKDIMIRGMGPEPFDVTRIRATLRRGGVTSGPQLVSRWMIEPVEKTTTPVWVWGAGHVGRALIRVLSPVPDFDLTWIDTHVSRFPDVPPEDVTILPAQEPETLGAYAPYNALHLIVTFSHNLDLELCHRLLGRGFGFAGLIGSKTKWNRFQKRLAALGHSPVQVQRITCPIGTPHLGKHPHVIALGAAAQLVDQLHIKPTALEHHA